MAAVTPRQDQPAPGRQLTGRMVFAMLVAFFGAVILMNIVMLRAAITTFSGVGEKNAYMAGVSHNRALDAARAQDALGWIVDAHLSRVAAGRSAVSLARRDAASAAGVTATVRFEHPSDSRQDRQVTLPAVKPGAWRGALDLPAGTWDFVIEMSAGGEILFRSRERVTVDDMKLDADG